MSLSYADMQRTLMHELRLYHYPIAVKYFFSDEDIAAFKATGQYEIPIRPLTFCQSEIAARMQGRIIFADKTTMGCDNARCVLGFSEIDEAEIKRHMKYARSFEQAERFVRDKPSFPYGELKGFAVAPLDKAPYEPDVVHFYCDPMQAYLLEVDYVTSTDQHPLRPYLTVSSAACGGCVYTFKEQTFNMVPACSGSYNAGKTERTELNVMIPGNHIAGVVERLMERMEQKGGSAISRPGDPFPGADICKNCTVIGFKKEKKAE